MGEMQGACQREVWPPVPPFCEFRDPDGRRNFGAQVSCRETYMAAKTAPITPKTTTLYRALIYQTVTGRPSKVVPT